ncbi:MAG TPA: GNAT family N-acetyltransferase [Nitrospiraceae bacterium]|nr:GNAT family N-acetyltransferase [Nitrospiraceae bacterium]
MGALRDIEFREGEFLVKTLGGAQLTQSYRLRHKVFAESLKWVPAAPDREEVDMYDLWGATVGLLHADGTLLGMARLLPSSGQFMLENEFGALLPGEYSIRKDPDTAEITRLAVDPDIRDARLSSRIMLAVLKGVYQWAVENDIRYYYLEVEHRFLRALRILGFPCEPVGPPVKLPPAGASAVAAMYDMVRFDEENVRKKPDFLRWISTIETVEGQVLPGRTSIFSQAGGLKPAAMGNRADESRLVVPGSVAA